MTPEEIAGMIGKMIVVNNLRDENIQLMLVQGKTDTCCICEVLDLFRLFYAF